MKHFNLGFLVLVFGLTFAQAKVTPGIQRVWRSGYFPEPAQILSRPSGRPFTISVEGNVGSGKSTFLDFFRGYPDIAVYQEPVDLWTDYNGTDFLGLVYNNTERWGFAFQSLVSFSMLETHEKDMRGKDGVITPPVKIMERSMQSGRYCFIEEMTDRITSAEKKLLVDWYEIIRNTTDVDVDAIVYLRTDPEVIYERINKRNRQEEMKIPLSYFQHLHQLHENWLIHQNVTTIAPMPRVIVIDANTDISQLKLTYRQFAKDLYKDIPEVMRTGKQFRFCSKHC